MRDRPELVRHPVRVKTQLSCSDRAAPIGMTISGTFLSSDTHTGGQAPRLAGMLIFRLHASPRFPHSRPRHRRATFVADPIAADEQTGHIINYHAGSTDESARGCIVDSRCSDHVRQEAKRRHLLTPTGLHEVQRVFDLWTHGRALFIFAQIPGGMEDRSVIWPSRAESEWFERYSGSSSPSAKRRPRPGHFVRATSRQATARERWSQRGDGCSQRGRRGSTDQPAAG